MKFQCQPVDVSFLDDPPVLIVNEIELEASAAAVFDVFADADSWPKWFPSIDSAEYTSEPPYGIGTTRTIRSALTAHETFMVWEPGKAFGFYFNALSGPWFRSFAEIYQLEDIGENRCRFTWRTGYKTSFLGWLFRSIVFRKINGALAAARDGLAQYLRK